MFKRFFSISALALCLAVFLTACSTESSKTYTYAVDKGDNIDITVDTKQDYDITSDVPFTISCGDESIFTGMFLYGADYDTYRSAYDVEETAELIDEGEKDGNEYFAFALPNEVDYFVRVAGSDTAVVFASLMDTETAAAAFDAITVSVAE